MSASDDKPDFSKYDYFGHPIDVASKYCTRCGRSLLYLQEHRVWKGSKVYPLCRDDVTAISHLVRKFSPPESKS